MNNGRKGQERKKKDKEHLHTEAYKIRQTKIDKDLNIYKNSAQNT